MIDYSEEWTAEDELLAEELAILDADGLDYLEFLDEIDYEY